MPQKKDLWRDFVESFRAKDAFLYAKLQNLPYSEDESSVSVTVNLSIHTDGKELVHKLETEFRSFSAGKKLFSVNFDKGESSSIYSEDELRRMKEIEARREKMTESEAVKTALGMGFEIKGVFTNEK